MKKDKGFVLEPLFKHHYLTVIFVTVTLHVAVWLSTYIFKESHLVIALIPFTFVLFAYLLGKDYADDKQEKLSYRLVILSLYLFLFTMINHIFIQLGANFESPEKQASVFKLSYFINVGMLLGGFSLSRKDGVKAFIDQVRQESFLARLGISTSANDPKPGDVIVAYEPETGKPDYLPFKDRFLHMLVLGPTGSGKTSQTIIPMLNQDMQNPDCGITVIEPKADLAEKVYAMAKHYDRDVIYFNPTLPNCPYFNPLFGKEDEVIENIATTFKMLSPDSPQFFMDMNEGLIRNALKVLKRTLHDDATFIDLYTLIANPDGAGRKMVVDFSRLEADTPEMAKENSDVAQYFLNDYFNEKSKTYEHCSAVRTQVGKIISNKYLRKVLNPPPGRNDIDFDKHLAEGGVIAIATAQGALRDLGRFLGYFIILQFQSAVFRRPGNEHTRLAHFLYIDEFQVYANPQFEEMLTQGRSYRVASHLATQNRALMGKGRGQEGKDFIEVVSTNARNIIIYPGGNATDAKYYSQQFGEIMRKTTQKGVSQAQFNPLYGFQRIGYANVSSREVEKLEALFSPSDLIYRPFTEITYLLIKNNSIQQPKAGKIKFIPIELNEKLDKMIDAYNRDVFKKDEEVIKQESLDRKREPDLSPDIIEASGIPDRLKGGVSAFTKYEKKENREFVDPSKEYQDDIVETDEEPLVDLGGEISHEHDEEEFVDTREMDDDYDDDSFLSFEDDDDILI